MKGLVTFAAAALLSTAALAQNETTPPPQPSTTPPAASPQSGSIFDALDADHSGSLAQQEAQAHATVAQHFSTADANGDGNLSREEFSAAFKTQ
jgi:hypothetical protein